MTQTTKANLKPAVIRNLLTKDEVKCMFNPHEYTLTKQNQWTKDRTKGTNVPKVKFSQGGAETLKLRLFFDTYAENTDVRQHTQLLWDMMMVAENKKKRQSNKSEPPHVCFEWGVFSFEAVITNITQKFTLFNKDGVPLRTTVDISFQQVTDEQRHHKQNPTSGDGPAVKTHLVQGGDRLDMIASKFYDDSTLWRIIARENGITHPLRLKPGQQLIIPQLD